MQHNRRKGVKLSQGSDVLHSIFENGKSPLSEQFIRWKLWRKWPDFVGSTISAISEPVSYRRGILYIWVKNSTWMQQMVFMLEPIKDKINTQLGIQYVKTIHLTLDRRSVPTNEDSPELRQQIAQIIGDFED
jgi:hypothetical protein